MSTQELQGDRRRVVGRSTFFSFSVGFPFSVFEFVAKGWIGRDPFEFWLWLLPASLMVALWPIVLGKRLAYLGLSRLWISVCLLPVIGMLWEFHARELRAAGLMAIAVALLQLPLVWLKPPKAAESPEVGGIGGPSN